MKKRNQLDNKLLEVYRDITDDVVESDFVPYACLFDANTILTKNGELLQIIKITGFTYEAISNDDVDLRNVIRQAIMQGIDSNEYAVWFHTLRRKKNLSPDGQYPDEFSDRLHKAWKLRNEWDRKYTNELYVTIVKDGQPAEIHSPKGFIEGLIPAVDRRVRNKYLERIAPELDATVVRILDALRDFGAKRLTMVKRGDRYYGEHLEFLEKLINLEERPMPIEEMALSDYLTSGEISFAYNAMEVRTAEEHRRFGAILTVKEYKEAALYKIDEIMQVPCEFIVTQCIDFINAKRALEVYEGQKYFLGVSGDIELAEKSELTKIIESNRNHQTDYGEQQTTIFVIGSSVSELERSLQQMREALNEVGMVVIREDLKFEECYWAHLPANFEFISRLGYTYTGHAAGFVNIQNYPAGNAKGCPWGPPVTVFYTAAGTPYFFNFHLGYNGHTTVIGPYGSGKSVLINFLISESRKYRNRLFYLDAHAHARHFIEAIGGNYFDLCDPNSTYHHLSPLSLPDSSTNREFLSLWLTTLVDPEGSMLNDNMIAMFRDVVNQVYGMEPAQRTLANVASLIEKYNPMLTEKLAPWYGEGELAFYFDHVGESVEPKNGIIGFNLSGLIHNTRIRVPVAAYLLHRITMTLDGTPSIFMLDEAWKLFNAPMFKTRVPNWMQYVASKNGLAIFACEDIEEIEEFPYSASIVQNAATQIYLPDEDPEDVYLDVLGLTEEEFSYLEAMSVEYRHFMLKRANESIIAELNLGGMNEVLAVLSGNMALLEETQDQIQGIELMDDIYGLDELDDVEEA